ncbi:MAG: hypothetical protein UFA98_10350 [Ruminococcus sp.]|nr:hypothetical protein [Ruminococcus sp.]
MKKIIAALLALTFAASLCSCSTSTGGGASVAETEQITEEATKFSTNVDDYVYPEKKVSKPYTGSFQITGEEGIDGNAPSRMPQLNMDTRDASEINDDIHSKYDEIFKSLESADESTLQPRTDYQAYLNDNILSLIIETRSVNTPNSGFNVYSINVETGQKVSSDEIIAMSSVDKENAEKLLSAQISEKFNTLETASDGMKSAGEEAKRKSLAGDNISNAVYYFNGERKLTAAYKYYWMVGAETYGAISSLDAEKTRG